jgi:hypothetical protein
MAVNFLSGNVRSDSSDAKDNVNAGNVMQHGTLTKAEWTSFPFCSGRGLNADLEYRNNSLENVELFITPKLAGLEQRNRYALLNQMVQSYYSTVK